MKKVKSGFALTELLIGMAIVAVVAGYGIKNGKEATDKALTWKTEQYSEFYQAALAELNYKTSTINEIENETYVKNGIEFTTENKCSTGEYGFQIAAVNLSKDNKKYIIEGAEGCEASQVNGEAVYFDSCSSNTQYTMIRKGVCYVG